MTSDSHRHVVQEPRDDRFAGHFVADGFDIPWNRLLEQATIGLGFVVALFLAGHVFLRMRELAK